MIDRCNLLHMAIGLDEVGRGAWAGPLLVVAARQLDDLPESLTDSKLLSTKQRNSLFAILNSCAVFGEGWVTASEIDHHGLAGALRIGVSRALSAIKALPIEEIILDGSTNYVDKSYVHASAVVKADLSEPIVSAASVYAKVARDRYMDGLSNKHSKYGFEKHVGYGTAAHKLAIQTYGTIKDVHRFSFKPVLELAG